MEPPTEGGGGGERVVLLAGRGAGPRAARAGAELLGPAGARGVCGPRRRSSRRRRWVAVGLREAGYGGGGGSGSCE